MNTEQMMAMAVVAAVAAGLVVGLYLRPVAKWIGSMMARVAQPLKRGTAAGDAAAAKSPTKIPRGKAAAKGKKQLNKRAGKTKTKSTTGKGKKTVADSGVKRGPGRPKQQRAITAIESVEPSQHIDSIPDQANPAPTDQIVSAETLPPLSPERMQQLAALMASWQEGGQAAPSEAVQ